MTRRLGGVGALGALLALGAGCSLLTDSFSVNDFSGDPFPTRVDTTTGALLVGVRQDGVPDRVAVLDVLAPLTVVDPGLGTSPSISTPDLTLLGARTVGGPLDLPRARFTAPDVLAIHPCADATCVVGVDATAAVTAVIGGNALAGDALRLRVGDAEVYILPDIAGDDVTRGQACDAVFHGPFAGGGTLSVGGADLAFAGRRIALGVCLAPDPTIPTPPTAPIAQATRGTNALLVASTGVGPTLLSETAYARYQAAHPTAPLLAALPAATVHLTSGPIAGHRTTIPSLALVPLSATAAPRAPCREVYAHHLLTVRDCTLTDDCPCTSGQVCGAAAVVELTPAAGLDVVVIPDADPLLQGLRTELRVAQPEVDGVLGAAALASLELDVDYPNNRLLGRCAGLGCAARPALTTTTVRAQIQACLP